MTLQDALNRAGWTLAFAIAATIFLALTFMANSAKSDVQQLERAIIAAERQKLLLETEFQARASQRQLAAWNAVEFGYAAPRGDQFIDDERELVALASSPLRSAPEPIRLVRTVQPRHQDGQISSLVTAVAGLPIEETRISFNKVATLFDAAQTGDKATALSGLTATSSWGDSSLGLRLAANGSTSSSVLRAAE